jgi:hypothetical protein
MAGLVGEAAGSCRAYRGERRGRELEEGRADGGSGGEDVAAPATGKMRRRREVAGNGDWRQEIRGRG